MTTLRPVAFGMIATVAFALAATADDKDKGKEKATQTINTRGVSFRAPSAWKSTTPKSSMRAAQLTAPPAEGDADPAELIVFHFPAQPGTVEANIERWESQFQGPDGKPARAKAEPRKGENADVTFVELAGRYVAPIVPGRAERHDKADYRLLGALLQGPRGTYILKMVGPDKTMKALKPAFEDLVSSLKVED